MFCALRYCEAIATSLKMTKVPSPYHTLTFVNQLRELSERISGTGAVDKSGSWISRTVPKPTLDGLGSWFEGRITKFVAGEGNDSPTVPSHAPSSSLSSNKEVGPFSHYNAISPAPSTAPSLSGGDSSTDLRRVGSAVGFGGHAGMGMSTINPLPDRSASATDFSRGAGPSSSSAKWGQPSSYSAEPSRTSFEQSRSGYAPYDAGQNGSSYGDYSSRPSLESTATAPLPATSDSYSWGVDTSRPSEDTANDYQQQQPSYGQWGSSSRTSLDNARPATNDYSAQPQTSSTSWARMDEEEEDDDLGLGNSKPKPKKAPPPPVQQGGKAVETSDEMTPKATKSEDKKRAFPSFFFLRLRLSLSFNAE